MLGFGLGGAASSGLNGLGFGGVCRCGTRGYLESECFADFDLVADKWRDELHAVAVFDAAYGAFLQVTRKNRRNASYNYPHKTL